MSVDIRQRKRTGETRMLTIGALSRATHIPAETLRSWERRYGSPVAVRKPSGHRVYPAATVEQLRRVVRLLAHGHRPGELLVLSTRALDSMLALSEPSAPALAPGPEAAPATAPGSAGAAVEALMRATSALDPDALGAELQASWVRFGPLSFLEEVAGPFMAEVGRAWGARALGIRHEHMASACLSDFLRGAREPYDRAARGPRVVATTLPGDAHEGGLLIVSLLLALHGHRVVYLGLDTPVEEIAAAVLDRDAEAVAVSVSAAVPKRRAAAALARLRESLPPRLPLWTGGAGAPASARGVERFASLGQLAERLRGGS